MKSEARILVSACSEKTEVCVGAIVRGFGVDGFVAARGCADLCSLLDSRGYMGELRYYKGPCNCGLRALPRETAWATAYTSFLDRTLASLERLVEELGDLRLSDSVSPPS